MSALQAETCLHLATIGGTTHRQHVHAAGQVRAKYLLPRTHIREIYIFFEHPAPAAGATLPLLPLSPAPPAACQHQRFVWSRMCGRARLPNCRNPCTGHSHLPPSLPPFFLLLPLRSRQTTCHTANALFVFQRDASSAAAAEEAAAEAASYFIHGKWQLHVNCDAATWPARQRLFQCQCQSHCQC